MRNPVDRRGFLKAMGAAGASIGWSGATVADLLAEEASSDASFAASRDWCLGCAAFTFHPFSFYETLDFVEKLGLQRIEAFSWQPLSKENLSCQSNHDMPAADRAEARKRLADKGIRLVSCYYGLPAASDFRKMFDWAKEMGIGCIVTEPPFDVYDSLDALCQEYQIDLAIHNHAKPSAYWHPDIVAEHLQGHSRRLGACCDTGHWVRSGLDPVKMMKRLEGRILAFHLKDIAVAGVVEAPCVPFGKGKGDIVGILDEARRQKYRGSFFIEYEPYSPETYARIGECIAQFQVSLSEASQAAE